MRDFPGYGVVLMEPDASPLTETGVFLSEESLLSSLLLSLTNSFMQATLTSKGQITIPVHVRNRLHLKPGDVLEFDETAPFLKATKTIPTEAWEQFGKAATNPWGGMSVLEIMDELRGPVELPAAEPA
jgi:AbrB family looped-hinge helix DNA binding protein